MLYNIDGKYYVLVGRKYIRIIPEVKGDEVVLTPNQKEYIEKTDSVVAKEQPFNEEFQKLIKNRTEREKREVREDREVRTRKNRYTR